MMSHSGNDFFDKSRSEDHSQNNPLHESILACDTSLSLSLIKEEKNGELINQKNLENTALMLALKTGNIKVALAIIAHTNVNQPSLHADGRGLTPLHYACMLRNNELIQQILDKDPEILQRSANIKGWWAEITDKNMAKLYERDSIMTPFDLYCNDIKTDYRTSSFVFIDNARFHLPLLPAYTDMLSFFMRSLWHNLEIPTPPGVANPDFKFLDEKNSRSENVFRHNFNEGYKGFARYRNSLSIDEALAKTLITTQDKEQRINFLMDKQRVKESAKQLAALSLTSSTELPPDLKIEVELKESSDKKNTGTSSSTNTPPFTG